MKLANYQLTGNHQFQTRHGFLVPTKKSCNLVKFTLYSNFPQVGKLADLVIWKPSFFGAKPEMVIKGGTIAWANMGDPNASIPTPEPVNSSFVYLDEHFSNECHRLCF